jgi:acyl-CoA thioester hydrolase
MIQSITHKITITVQYSDTDQMGFVHHSNYVKYYETARWELFRSIGIPYKSIEYPGFLLPVIEMKFKFIKPAFYDELLTVETKMRTMKGARIWFAYKMLNSKGELINEAETILAFITKENNKPCHPPEFVLKAIKKLVYPNL